MPDRDSVINQSYEQFHDIKHQNYEDAAFSSHIKKPYRKKKTGLLRIIGLIAGAVAIVMVLFFVISALTKTNNNSNIPSQNVLEEQTAYNKQIMPDYSGFDEADASKNLRDNGITRIYIVSVSNPSEEGFEGYYADNQVIYTEPAPGSEVDKNSDVYLHVYYAKTDEVLFEIRITDLGNNVKVRTSPSTKEGNNNKIGNVKTGEVYSVYQTIYNGEDSLTWYRIGENMWIADGGGWVEQYTPGENQVSISEILNSNTNVIEIINGPIPFKTEPKDSAEPTTYAGTEFANIGEKYEIYTITPGTDEFGHSWAKLSEGVYLCIGPDNDLWVKPLN